MIKNLLFDLGGVIMDIRKERCVEAFERLGLANAKSYFGEFSQNGPFKLIEEGAISEDKFHEILRAELPDGVTAADIDHAFCRFLIGIPTHRLASLRALAARYHIYLLSNTNSIMWEATIKDEFRKEGRELDDYFEGTVTSFEARSLKPDEEIFRYAVDKLGIMPEETLFLDDSEANLTTAARLGFKTQLVAPGHEFTEFVAP